MRKCIRCNVEMVENLEMLTYDGLYIGVKEEGSFKSTFGKVKCAVCAECGYIENYIDDVEKLKKKLAK